MVFIVFEWFLFLIFLCISIFRLPFKKVPRKVVFEKNELSCDDEVKTSFQDSKSLDLEGFSNDESLDSGDLDPRVQQALDKMNQQIVQLKYELDEEKSKNMSLEQKINNLFAAK